MIETGNHLISILLLAFSLGMIHALDADHIMAVSSLAGRRPGIKSSIAFCSRWAIGHGLALLVISLFVLLLGWAIPVSLSQWAEQLVGLVLILLGLWVYWDMSRRHIHLHFHRHGKGLLHAHWHQHPAQERHPDSHHQHTHSATLVGVLHGTAGSAPLLALLPISQAVSPWVGIAYVVVFGMGVFIAMLLFGGVLGRLFALGAKKGTRLINLVRGVIAGGSVFYGAYLLNGVFK